MISFDRKDNKIICRVSDEINTNTSWSFEHEVSHKSEAEICKRHFENKLEDRIESIREKAYEDGYKDGKNHQKKIKTFCRWMSENLTGWR